MATDPRRFVVREVLGEGGFGKVYRADQLGDGGFVRPVALKVLKPEMQHEESLARLRDEARVLGMLRHRSIVSVGELLMLDGRWTVVMEYIDGIDLSRIDRPVPPGTCCEILQEAASALATAYDEPIADGRVLRVLHRDIKPGNLQLTRAGDVKVLDFGIARADIGGREADTRSYLVGSPRYMSPERLEGEQAHESDVYSLGVVAFELLTVEDYGRTSVREDRHRELVEKQLARIADVAPPELLALIRDCLAYAPTDRPTAREVARRTRDIRRQSNDVWLADWAAEVVPAVQASSPPSTWDERVGTELRVGRGTDTPTPTPMPIAAPSSTRWLGPILALGLSVGAFVFVSIGAAAIGLGWWFAPRAPAEGVVAPIPSPAPVEVAPEPVAPPPVTPDPVPAVPPPPPPRPRPVVPPPPAPPSGVRITLAGDATAAELVGGGRKFPLPGAVPEGTYVVRAEFPGTGWVDAGQVVVLPGAAGTLHCTAGFFRCSL